VKSLTLSKPIFANEVNKITLDFTWNHKPPKIKYSTLIKTKKEGGLEMKDLSLFDKPSRLNWVK